MAVGREANTGSRWEKVWYKSCLPQHCTSSVTASFFLTLLFVMLAVITRFHSRQPNVRSSRYLASGPSQANLQGVKLWLHWAAKIMCN